MAAPTPTLFITGISGFVGRALLQRLAPRRVPDGKGERPERILGLSRNVTAVAQPNVELVRGDLERPEAWVSQLERAEVVVHMAASVGKVAAEVHERVNVEGTRRLIEAAKAAGVRRFLYVSTIAATYPELDHYPYGRSKARAEELVRASGMEWSILRPTIVLGPRSPAWQSLSALARMPVMPVFGSGEARMQPVAVEDLADAIALWIDDDALLGRELDLGGPEVVETGEFLSRVRRASKGKAGPVLHLPARGLIRVLSPLERFVRPLLPFTAGQLYAFVYDGVAAPNPLMERLVDGMRGVDAMIAELSRG
jgi:NADH dehydrogenase